jgi:uncharacterized protein YjbI with pentapeptide repeats
VNLTDANLNGANLLNTDSEKQEKPKGNS